MPGIACSVAATDDQALRETPLSHSVCQYALLSDGLLIIDDARLDERLIG